MNYEMNYLTYLIDFFLFVVVLLHFENFEVNYHLIYYLINYHFQMIIYLSLCFYYDLCCLYLFLEENLEKIEFLYFQFLKFLFLFLFCFLYFFLLCLFYLYCLRFLFLYCYFFGLILLQIHHYL